MWHHALSRIWRNLHRDIEIDGNWRSEELLKLGGGQKFLFFGGEEGGRLSYEAEDRFFEGASPRREG